VSMNIRQRCRQIALVTIFGTSSLGLGISQADAFTFQDVNTAQLEFFNGSGTLVGNGRITYKPFSGSLVNSPPQFYAVYEDPNNPFPPFDQGGPLLSGRFTPPAGYAQVTSFSADLFAIGTRIPGYNYGTNGLSTGQSVFGGLYLWQPPNTETFVGGAPDTLLAVSGGDPRSPGISSRNTWFDCLPSCGTSQRQIYQISSDGTWSFFNILAPSTGSLGGTWRATAVPEPGTLAGSVIAAITLWGVKHRRSRKRVG
jgi:hypothetical protein